MSRHGHKQDINLPQEKSRKRYQGTFESQELTPGRASSEGPDDISSPSHERSEQGTAGRAPAEGADIASQSRKQPRHK